MLRILLLAALATVGTTLSTGSAVAWEGPIEKLVETREDDRNEASAEGVDPVDALFAPADDAFADMNKDMNQQSDADNPPAGSAEDQK